MFRLAQKENLIIPAHIDYLASLRDFITQIGKKYHFSHKFVNTFKLAVDEAATNIIKHAYSESEGYITIQAVIKSNSLTLKILDQGAYFDPKWAQELDLKKSVNTDEKMGLGIFMMRKLMDQVEYKKSTSGNELTLTKKDKFKKRKLRLFKLFKLSNLPTALKIRYLIHALIFVTVLNGSGYTYYHTIASAEVKADFIQAGKKISKQVTQQLCAIKPEILNGPDGLSYLKAIILPIYDENLGRIYSLSLEDSLGFIAWSTIPTELNSSFKRPGLNTKYEESIFNYSIGRENEIYEFESELEFETGKAFYKKLHVLISSTYLMHEIKRQRITYLKYTLISLGLCFIIIAFISYFVSHPIHKLTKWVRAAKTGDLQDEMDIDATTEIGEIAQAFSDMTEKFNQSQKHLAVREKYEKEINLAKDIQRSLLPREIPEIETLEISAYYEPAKTVGGDFYDFIEVDQDHLGIAVADVSGKGVPGSLMMTIIRTALRTEARGSNDAAEVLTRVNDFVVNDMKNGMFATIFYIIINTKTLVVNFASAGHNPLILYNRSIKRCFNLNPSGFPVGIKLPIKDYFAQNIKSETIQMAQDELILIYTDGITEAMSPAKQLYGEKQLTNIIRKSANLTLTKFTEKLKNSIYSFTEDGALHDDVTFIAIKPKKKTTNDIEYDRSLSVNVNFLSIDDSNKIIDIVRSDPNLGAEEISQKLTTKKYGTLQLEPERVLSELARRQLHTVSLRLKYVESKDKTHLNPAKLRGVNKVPEAPPYQETVKKNKKGTDKNQREQSASINPPFVGKSDKPDSIDSVIAEDESSTMLSDFINVLQPEPAEETQDGSKKPEPKKSADAVGTPEISETSGKASDASEITETPATDIIKSSEIAETSKSPEAPAVVKSKKKSEESEPADLPETIEESESTESSDVLEEPTPDQVVDGTETTEAEDNQVESFEAVEKEKDIAFDISESVDISDLLVDSIFDKFLKEALDEDTLQPGLEENAVITEADEPAEAAVDNDETKSAELDIDETSEEESDIKAPEDEQPAAAKLETIATEASEETGDVKSVSKKKKAKPECEEKTKTKQIDLKPFVAPSEKSQDFLEYEFILGNASEFIEFEINDECEFEDINDLSSDLDVEFKRELELEEYELVLDEIEKIISDEAASESTKTTESAVESDAQPKDTATPLADKAEFFAPELKEDIPSQTGNAEDFGLELFANLDEYGEDTFAQDLAEFDEPDLAEERTWKKTEVQKPRPFLELEANEFEDVYRTKPFHPRKSQSQDTETSEEKEPTTEALQIKAQLIEEPVSEPVEISSAQTATTESEAPPPEVEQAIPSKVPQTKDEKDEFKEHLMTGVKHYKNKEYEDAIIFLKKVIKLNPNEKEAFAMLGNAYYRNGMLYEAIMAYEQLKPSNLKDPSIHENLGLIYWKLNLKEKALSAWQTVLELTPDRADIKKRIAYLKQKGTQDLKNQIKINSHKQNGAAKNSASDNGKQAILKKALDQYRSQDYKSAIDSLKSALEHFPENVEVYTYLANAYFRNKMFDDAVKIYERLKQIDENNINVLENLGMVHLKQGSFKQAITEWQKIVARQPGRADLKQKIAKVSELIENN